MLNLAAGQCVPCRKGEPLLTESEISDLQFHVPQWKIIRADSITRLERTFTFKDFSTAMQFASQIANMAEAQGHHPRMVVEWGSVRVAWWTHILGGLHRNDFIMAAKTDECFG